MTAATGICRPCIIDAPELGWIQEAVLSGGEQFQQVTSQRPLDLSAARGYHLRSVTEYLMEHEPITPIINLVSWHACICLSHTIACLLAGLIAVACHAQIHHAHRRPCELVCMWSNGFGGYRLIKHAPTMPVISLVNLQACLCM